MQSVLRLYATAINSVLALVLALNALGWAAHVDVPVPTENPHSAHIHIVASSQPADRPPSGLDQSLSVNDHCGHAHASDARVVELTSHFAPSGDGEVAPRATSNYTSLAIQPPLGPPIA